MSDTYPGAPNPINSTYIGLFRPRKGSSSMSEVCSGMFWYFEIAELCLSKGDEAYGVQSLLVLEFAGSAWDFWYFSGLSSWHGETCTDDEGITKRLCKIFG